MLALAFPTCSGVLFEEQRRCCLPTLAVSRNYCVNDARVETRTQRSKYMRTQSFRGIRVRVTVAAGVLDSERVWTRKSAGHAQAIVRCTRGGTAFDPVPRPVTGRRR